MVFRLFAYRLAVVGKSWYSFFDPNLLIMDLKTIGFKQAEDTGSKDINRRFNDRADKLMVGSFVHLMKAQLLKNAQQINSLNFNSATLHLLR